MTPSTVVELAGFAFLDAAAWHLGSLSGLLGTGALLLFIGYALEDDKTLVALRGLAAALRHLASLRKRRTGTESTR